MILVIRSKLLIIFVFLSVFFAYTMFLGWWSGLWPHWGQLRMEIPLCLLTYFLFCMILKKTKWRYVIGATPLIIFYLVFEIYYISYGRLLRLIDMKEAVELYEVVPWYVFFAGLLVIIFPMAIYFSFLDFDKYKRSFWGLGLVSLTFFLMIRFLPEVCVDCFYQVSESYVNWSDKSNVEDNGRASMMLYWEASRQQAHFKAYEYSAVTPVEKIMKSKEDGVVSLLRSEKNLRNVHVVVLESFVDPTLLTKVTFSENPFYKPLRDLLAGKENVSLSPVFAGGTPQAEFEILTGAPALQRFESIEFNVFSGAEVFCFPAMMKKAGYRTIASNAYKPSAFNALKAYKGLGFEEVYFPLEEMPSGETYLSTGDISKEWYMFDGDVFDQNLAFIQKHFQQKDRRPLFNYVISVYGHYPFLIDYEKRPKRITTFVDGEKRDGNLARIADQFYYRTKALYEYISSLNQLDPHSIVIVISDHLPLIKSWRHDYQELGYVESSADHSSENIFYLLVDGKPVKKDQISHFEIPNLILNQLTSGKYKNNFPDRFVKSKSSKALEKKYYNIMVNAITK